MSTPTTLVADRYRLVRLLGAGGMGVVWQADDEKLRRPVALKMLRTQPELTDTERELATDRAMREARITAGLHHPHAVAVFDVVEHEGQPCIVMQLIESTPLSVLLREHGTLSPEETARVGAQVASALAAAHKLRIVHRDVKPGNILITADGSAMISDFGISHALGDSTITATGMIHGTPAYLAPEVARGLPTSFASDVYSLGSTLYTMLEGQPPFGADKNAIALLHRVARGGYPPPKHAGPLKPLLTKMLAANPKARPRMDAVVESLTALSEAQRSSRIAAFTALLPAPPDERHESPSAAATVPMDPAEITPAPSEATTVSADQRAAAAAAATVPMDPAEITPAPSEATTVPADVGRADTTETVPDDRIGRPASAAAAAAAGAAAAQSTVVQPTAEQPTALQPTAVQPRTTGVTEPTVRFDPPTRDDAPTAETEPLLPPPRQEPAPTAEAFQASARGRRRTAVTLGILAVVAVVVLAAFVLLNPLFPADNPAADPAETAMPAASETAEASPSESPTPEPEVAPPAVEEAPVAPAPETATPEQRAAETVTGYYAMLPGNLDAAWPLMTGDYQENHAGGRGAYEAFWGNISAVEIADVTATAGDQVQATLTYYFVDGSATQEVTAYRLVDEGGVLKIAASEVLSSTSL